MGWRCKNGTYEEYYKDSETKNMAYQDVAKQEQAKEKKGESRGRRRRGRRRGEGITMCTLPFSLPPADAFKVLRRDREIIL